MDDFSGYEKMPNSLKKIGLAENELSNMDKVKWVVTEKVHGANFSFVYENGILKYAKRKNYLSWNDDFFGFQLVVNEIEDKVLSLFEDIEESERVGKYIVYGELFGGEYPHDEVAPNENVKAIQTGVYYAPSIHFCAFDIAIEENGEKQYLDYETSVSYFEKHEILYAKSLFVGKFADALNFNKRINSTIPKAFDLPVLKENLIEGIVVKPFSKVEKSMFSSRPILKLKNPEFDEEKKFHEAEKWTYVPNVSSKTEDLSFILEELRNYITLNRLESAISKIGELNREDEQRVTEIREEFLRDAKVDFNENNNDLLEDLKKEEKEWLISRVESLIRLIMKENL